MTPVQIAMVAHEINRAYCDAIGDDSQPPWGEAAAWQRESVMNGVAFHQAHPQAGPEARHEHWVRQKEAEGWSYGEVKDVEKKTHPCCRPYHELPVEHRAKDYLFRAVVHVLGEFKNS